MERPSSNVDVLRALRDLGLRLAIDNFGTGRSSLAYLKWLPIDAIKIDRSFVRWLDRDPEYATLVSAMIALVHTLDKAITAGGVETEDQLSCLRELGCGVCQGSYFSEPLRPEAADALLAQRACR